MVRERVVTGSWMLGPTGRSGRRKGSGFLESTLRGIARTLQDAIFYEEMAQRPGFLQSLDPRARLVGLLGLILAVSLARQIWTLAIFYLLVLALAAISRIPVLFFIKRVWLFMPLFTGIVALPVIFNVVTPGRPVITLLDLGRPWSFSFLSLPGEIALTEQGLRTAFTLILRVGDSVSLAVLLVTTSRWAHLLKALRVFRVPQVFVLIMAMTYRYIFVLLQITSSMLLARKSRTLGKLRGADHRRGLAASGGTLLAKSYHLSDEIYSAMLSRGFTGEAKVMDEFHMSGPDWLWLLTTGCLASFIMLLERI
ncbi:MAG: cobalt ECF transporter T component CbiQ [Dehalococcoidia bacterium]|nr:cobalt ECF transporter T component CbiQ [Dehalococcoidia bacterium]